MKLFFAASDGAVEVGPVDTQPGEPGAGCAAFVSAGAAGADAADGDAGAVGGGSALISAGAACTDAAGSVFVSAGADVVPVLLCAISRRTEPADIVSMKVNIKSKSMITFFMDAPLSSIMSFSGTPPP